MSLKSIKEELSELQAKPSGDIKDPVPLKRGEASELVSSNGIRYLDPRPTKYCMDYGMLVQPTLKSCQHCGSAWDVTKLMDEEWTWYLDPDSGNVTEHGDEESIPVQAFLKIATVSKKGNALDKIVYDRFKDMTDCPRHTFCKP